MKRVSQSSGFTIIETVIVLAVMAVMFVAISGTWSSKQRNNYYTTAIEETRSQILRVHSDVDNGYFPENNAFGCSNAGGVLQFSTTGTQGRNSDCVFMGKAIQFKVQTSDPETINIATVAAKNVSGAAVGDSIPTVAPTLTEEAVLKSDLETVRINVNGGTGFTGIAFLSDQGPTGGGVLQSGSAAIRVYGISGSLGGTKNFGASNNTSGMPLNAKLTGVNNDGARICFKSKGTRNLLLMTVGANGSAGDVRTVTTQVANCGI